VCFLALAEYSDREQRPLSDHRGPARHFQFVFDDQIRVGAIPIRLILELNVNPGGNIRVNLIFQELLAVRFVLVALLDATPQSFESVYV